MPRATGMAEATIDCAISVETLEHIPPADISAILKEIHRILRPDGVALMQIDYWRIISRASTRTISSFNFLTYSDRGVGAIPVPSSVRQSTASQPIS